MKTNLKHQVMIMKHASYVILALALSALAACSEETIPAPGAETVVPGEESCSGELFVKFDPYVSEIIESAAACTRSGEALTRSGILSVDEVLDLIGSYRIERVFPIDSRSEERTRAAGLHQWYLVRFCGDHSVAEVAERLSQLGEVQKTSLNSPSDAPTTPTGKPCP